MKTITCMGDLLKTCAKCRRTSEGIEQIQKDFGRDKNRPDQLTVYCKDCIKKRKFKKAHIADYQKVDWLETMLEWGHQVKIRWEILEDGYNKLVVVELEPLRGGQPPQMISAKTLRDALDKASRKVKEV